MPGDKWTVVTRRLHASKRDEYNGVTGCSGSTHRACILFLGASQDAPHVWADGRNPGVHPFLLPNHIAYARGLHSRHLPGERQVTILGRERLMLRASIFSLRASRVGVLWQANRLRVTTSDTRISQSLRDRVSACIRARLDRGIYSTAS